MDSIRNREQAYARQFRAVVSAIPGVRVYGDAAKPHAPIVTLNIGDRASGQVGDRLYAGYGICVRAGAHCAPLAHRALGTERQGAVRFSFSSFNTETEIEAAVAAVAAIATEGR